MPPSQCFPRCCCSPCMVCASGYFDHKTKQYLPASSLLFPVFWQISGLVGTTCERDIVFGSGVKPLGGVPPGMTSTEFMMDYTRCTLIYPSTSYGKETCPYPYQYVYDTFYFYPYPGGYFNPVGNNPTITYFDVQKCKGPPSGTSLLKNQNCYITWLGSNFQQTCPSGLIYGSGQTLPSGTPIATFFLKEYVDQSNNFHRPVCGPSGSGPGSLQAVMSGLYMTASCASGGVLENGAVQINLPSYTILSQLPSPYNTAPTGCALSQIPLSMQVSVAGGGQGCPNGTYTLVPMDTHGNTIGILPIDCNFSFGHLGQFLGGPSRTMSTPYYAFTSGCLSISIILFGCNVYADKNGNNPLTFTHQLAYSIAAKSNPSGYLCDCCQLYRSSLAYSPASGAWAQILAPAPGLLGYQGTCFSYDFHIQPNGSGYCAPPAGIGSIPFPTVTVVSPLC